MPRKEMEKLRALRNEELRQLEGDEPELKIEEAIGARLYTGPLFEKCAPPHCSMTSP